MGMLSRLGIVGAFMLVAGCGSWPPIVEAAHDVEMLSAHEPSVRARALADSDIHSLGRLKDLEWIDFESGWGVKDARITDRGLEVLSTLRLPALRMVTLGRNENITDNGLVHLASMSPLDWVGLHHCPGITDEGLSYLAEHAVFEGLDLRGCDGITDAGLAHLTANKHLRRLWLDGCHNVTAEAVRKARAAMPWADVTG